METAELDLLPREGDAASPAPRTAVAVAAEATVDLTSISLSDVALAQFGNWRTETAKVKADFEALALDLSTQARVDEAISLRHRKINQPLAEARRISKTVKSRLIEVSKTVGAELEKIEAAWADAETAITPLIDGAQKKIDDAKEVARLAEQQRLQGLRNKVDEILCPWVERCKTEGITAERIGNGVDALKRVAMPGGLSDVAAYWDTAKTETLKAMELLQLEAQRQENARAAADLAEQKRKLDEQAATLRTQEAEAAAKRQRELDERAEAARDEVEQATAQRAVEVIEAAVPVHLHTEAAQCGAVAPPSADARPESSESGAATPESPGPVLEAGTGLAGLRGMATGAARGATSVEIVERARIGWSNGQQEAAHGLSLNLADLDEDTPLETGEADARTPPAGVVEQALRVHGDMAARALASPIVLRSQLDQAQDLLRRALQMTEHIGLAFRSKFPTQPKMDPSWWAALRERVANLEPDLLMALAQEKAK